MEKRIKFLLSLKNLKKVLKRAQRKLFRPITLLWSLKNRKNLLVSSLAVLLTQPQTKRKEKWQALESKKSMLLWCLKEVEGTKVTWKMVWKTDKVNFNLMMGDTMLDNGKTIKCMALVNYIIRTVRLHMRVIGKMTNFVVLVAFSTTDLRN